jgi:uncharacterized membrane protein
LVSERSTSAREPARRRLHLTVILLGVIYSVGAWGMLSAHRQHFIALSFSNLLLTAALLLWNASGLRRGGLISFCVSAAIGFAVELLGVRTGWPFGNYSYTEHLGPRLWGVPLVIGLNWATLVHATQTALCRGLEFIRRDVPPNTVAWPLAALGATLMTAFDWCMEPAAMSLGFWVWQGDRVPLTNYIAWWVISLGLLRFGMTVSPSLRNPAAGWVLGVQALFFLLVAWTG